MRRALYCLVALVLLAGCGDAESSSTAKDAALAEALQRGGVVLVMRHALTESTTDRVEVIGDCTTQRNLSREGREQARRIGRDVKALDVPVDKVLASPLCRTMETADLAFGESTPSKPLLSAAEEATPEEDRRIRKLRAMSSAPEGSATVLVTHTGNIGGAFGLSVMEGEIVVVRDGKVLGTVRPEDWKRLADAAD